MLLLRPVFLCAHSTKSGRSCFPELILASPITRRKRIIRHEGGGFTLELNYYQKSSPNYTDYVVGEGLDHLAFGMEGLSKIFEDARKSGYRVISEMKTQRKAVGRTLKIRMGYGLKSSDNSSSRSERLESLVHVVPAIFSY